MLNGIGEKLERHIWRGGVLTWDDFCNCKEVAGISPERKASYDSELSRASTELKTGNAEYFAQAMKRREHWRLFDEFRDGAVCLDIETNGYQPNQGGYVTVVGLYDGYDWKCFVRGENLTAENLNNALEGYKCLITFYGACFDVPFLLKTFPTVKFNIPHFDLCFAARRLKIEGGMKKLETMFGIERDDSVKGMDGYAAVKLWERAALGSAEARDTLIAYNREDTQNLLAMADILYNRLKDSTGFEEYQKQ
jgi:uncharacterized protein YprB with RNaseH-like and TPR domain